MHKLIVYGNGVTNPNITIPHGMITYHGLISFFLTREYLTLQRKSFLREGTMGRCSIFHCVPTLPNCPRYCALIRWKFCLRALSLMPTCCSCFCTTWNPLSFTSERNQSLNQEKYFKPKSVMTAFSLFVIKEESSTTQPNLANICQSLSHSLSYLPSVGVAMAMPSGIGLPLPDFQGHVFFVFPLPVQKKSITGLPVHINGFFSLSQNRLYIKNT